VFASFVMNVGNCILGEAGRPLAVRLKEH